MVHDPGEAQHHVAEEGRVLHHLGESWREDPEEWPGQMPSYLPSWPAPQATAGDQREAHQAEEGPVPAAHRLLPTRAVCAKGLMFTRSLNPQNYLQGEMWLLFPFYTGENEAQRASEVQI